MQPITQASLDPKLNDIRHLRADQEFCGVIGCFGLTSPSPHFKTSPLIVRILPPLLQNHLFPRKNEGSEATLATHWTTHQGARQRTRRRSMCKHARAWTCRKAKAIGQICEKPWENQGFAAERTGTELFGVFPVFLGSSKGTLIWLLGHGALFYAEPYCAANLTLAR